ncbi:MAG: hypothetical protein BWX70_03338 [Verrucomicrobia bacterium ADurb.Bin070]|nr:MAG: hypothetical protein BWX70_03338 [Verrucomicrobia bacterium ADurb.Bin070]
MPSTIVSTKVFLPKSVKHERSVAGWRDSSRSAFSGSGRQVHRATSSAAAKIGYCTDHDSPNGFATSGSSRKPIEEPTAFTDCASERLLANVPGGETSRITGLPQT